MSKIGLDPFEMLGEMLEPPPPPAPVKDEMWSPSLNPVQQELFDCDERNVLAWGEKGSGKTTGLIHRLVRHCYDNTNALAFVLTPVKSMQDDGGAWHKLCTEILPEWAAGLGLHYKRGHDAQHNEIVWVQNRHNMWSQIKGISAPHPDQLRERFPGREPSLVFVDELTKCSTAEYFTAPSAQIGRRPHVEGRQQFLAACNPDGKSHWVYKKWFEEAFNEDTGEWDPDFVQIYVPLRDNEKNLQAGYAKSLESTYAHDPTELARMVGGEWVDRPSGEGLYRDLYNGLIHVLPRLEDGSINVKRWLKPVIGYPMIIGLDPGSVYNAFVFMQYLPIGGKYRWMIFDEIVTLKKRIDYADFVPMVMRRVRFWRNLVTANSQQMPQIWISDNSAFNQYRAAAGSFDVLQIEKIYEFNRERYKLEPLGKIKQAPKFAGSIIARVQMAQRLLGQDEIIVSSRCRRVQQMFLGIESEKQKAGEPFDPSIALKPKRSDHVHTHDAVTYPMLTASLDPRALVPFPPQTQTLYSARAA